MFLVPITGWKQRPPATGGFVDSTTWGDNSNSWGTSRTITGMALGTAAADRTIIACCVGVEGSGAISSLTIAGVSFTNRLSTTTGDCGIGMFTASVPTGTSGSMTLSFASGQTAIGVVIYAVYGLSSLVPTATATSVADPGTSGSLNINNGVGIGFGCPGHTSNPNSTWTGFTEDTFNYIYDAERGMTAASIFAAGSVTASNNWTALGDGVTLFAVWR
jgi:hypothetical protein